MSTLKQFLSRLPKDTNFSAFSDSLVFENKNQKRFSLLLSDIEESLRALWKNNDKVTKQFSGDWVYEEGKYRQGFGEAFKNLGSNTVSTNLGSQTPNTVRALEIYAGFLLNRIPEQDLHNPELLNKEALDQLFDLKTRFRNWLKNSKSLSQKTVTEYSNTIGGTISKIGGVDMYSIRSLKELDSIAEKVRTAEEYIGLNQRGGGMYEAALKRYEEFTQMEFENSALGSDKIIHSPDFISLHRAMLFCSIRTSLVQSSSTKAH